MSTPLEQALGRLVADGTLTDEQARAVSRELASQAPGTPGVPVGHAGPRSADRPGWTTLVAEIGGYVGGAFVLAAAIVLTGPRWGELGQSERIVLLAVPSLLLLAAAAAVLALTPGGWPVRHRRGAGPRRRLAAALVVVGGALLAGAVAVAARGTGDWQAVWYFGAATVVGALGYAVLRTPLLHVATAVAAASAAPIAASTYSDTWQREGLWAGLAVVAVAVVWLALTAAGVLAEAGLGLTVGGALAFIGGEIATTAEGLAWVGYLLLAAVAVAGLVAYVRTRHVGVLVVGVVALATVVPQAVIDYTDGELGAAGALLVTGLSILGASVLGLRLRGAAPSDDGPAGADAAPAVAAP